MTGEQAYWHACSGMPIDVVERPVAGLPAYAVGAFDPVHDAYEVMFIDGVVVTIASWAMAMPSETGRVLAAAYAEARRRMDRR